MQKTARILIVDDAEENRILLEELVGELGHTPLLAADGNEALTLIHQSKPDLVLLDIVMPWMDGYQTLTAIKTDHDIKNIPVVMISSIELSDSIIHCIRLGADDYLSKPFEPEILKARIDHCLAKYWHLQAEQELLEKTLSGSLKIVSDILSRFSPRIYGRSARLRPIVRQIAAELHADDLWEFEIATMLSHIGCTGLPQHILDKLSRGKPPLPNERNTFLQHPLIGAQLLNRLPRLENIAEMIKYQHKDYDGSGVPDDAVAGQNIPLGARILRVVMDYDAAVSANADQRAALDLLKTAHSLYDEGVISALEKVITNSMQQNVS
jgi:response regulator RpfG family c-di-GMP phosphodiesterase